MYKFIFLVLVISNFVFANVKIDELGRFGGTGTEKGKFKNPSAIDISDEGRVFVCDRGNNRIQVFDLKGYFIKDIGGFGSKNDQFDEPFDIWAKTTLNIFVADYNNQRIQRFDRELNFISAFYSNDGDDSRFQFREVLSVAHSSQGDLFILEAGENKVIKFQRETAQISFGYFDSGLGELYNPKQLEISPGQQVIVSDAGNHCINMYDYFGNYTKSIIHVDMKEPAGLAVDNTGRIYVTDTGSLQVFIFSKNGEFISSIDSISGKSVQYPTDIAVKLNNKNAYTAYLIDNEEVIIFSLKF